VKNLKSIFPFLITIVVSILLTLTIEHILLKRGYGNDISKQIYILNLKKIVETYQIKMMLDKTEGRNLTKDAESYYRNLLSILKGYNGLVIVSDAVVMPAPGMKDITDEIIDKTLPEIKQMERAKK
jgi:hypothetical protein